jgi:four helix bundle protein
MFLKLYHRNLNVYTAIRELTKEVYLQSNSLPDLERFNMVQQVRRAVLSVKLNFAEGSTRRSEVERKRYMEISRGSIVELDAAFETAVDLKYFKADELQIFSEMLNKCFAMISKMIK